MAKLLLFIVLVAIAWWLWQGGRKDGMSAAEARALLDLDAGADAEAIRAAHRRIIAKVHPDAGGSAELARRINQARDVLLKNPPPPSGAA